MEGAAESVIVVIGPVTCWRIVVGSWGEGEAWVWIRRRERRRRGSKVWVRVGVSIGAGRVGVLVVFDSVGIFIVVVTALVLRSIYCAIDSFCPFCVCSLSSFRAMFRPVSYVQLKVSTL